MNVRKLIILLIAVLFITLGFSAALRYREAFPRLLRGGMRSAATSVQNERSLNGARFGTNLVSNIKTALASIETDTAAVRTSFFAETNTREIRAAVPKGVPLEVTVHLLSEAAGKTAYTVYDCVQDARVGACNVLYHSRHAGKEHIRIIVTRAESYYSKTGRIAILIRDFGFEADQTTIDFLSFAHPLTVSLAAATGKSTWTARIADYYRKEIVIRIPMEPKIAGELRSTELPALMVHHTQDQISKTFGIAASRIPNFAGFCNVAGSRFLEDTRATRIMLDEVKRHNGYFIDARSTQLSMVPSAAEKASVAYRQIDASIDNNASEAQTIEQLQRFILRAQKSGTLLVTAPATGALIAALRKAEPIFSNNGIQLVYVSDILNHPEG